MASLHIAPPYLIFVGDAEHESTAKTAYGVIHWRPELCLGQYRLTGTAIDLGLRDQYLRDLSARLGIPRVDPLLDGVGPIVDDLARVER